MSNPTSSRKQLEPYMRGPYRNVPVGEGASAFVKGLPVNKGFNSQPHETHKPLDPAAGKDDKKRST
jgi:hypothetical protein